ncbi:PIN domain-containing protein [Nocardia sp. NPDC020380]|uniref:PIN domain-containing protein n=1 Tax=Nocardia sp. NPDC020380 TaxID=3364309 RepID=UPI0037AD53AC
MPPRAFLDANVLVPARLRDVLLTLAEAELYEVRWSADVLTEAARHLPDSMSDPARRSLFAAMARAFPDALVQWPDSLRIDVPDLVNAKDRRVVAAAMYSNAEVLVTNDRALCGQLDGRPEFLEAQTASAFIAFTIDSDMARAGRALIEMAARRWVGSELHGDAGEIRDRLAAWALRQLGGAVADLVSSKEFLGGG